MNTFTKFLKRHSLIAGLVLMFALTWPIDLSNSGVLPFRVPFVVSLLVGWGFILASLIMTGLTLGREGVSTLLKRYLIWRVNGKWYLVAFLLPPALQFVSVVVTTWLTGVPVDYGNVMIHKLVPVQANPLLLIIPWMLFEVITNGEEMGWRGYVLPRLQFRYSALVSSLILGVIWSLWHLPKFFGTGSSGGRSFTWFTIFCLAAAVLYTWLYNNTRGSLLMVTIFHATQNTTGMFLPVSFAVSGGVLQNIEIIVYVLAAVLVTIAAGAERLSRTEEKQVQVQFDETMGIDFQSVEKTL
jgi:uncharacterized protein